MVAYVCEPSTTETKTEKFSRLVASWPILEGKPQFMYVYITCMHAFRHINPQTYKHRYTNANEVKLTSLNYEFCKRIIKWEKEFYFIRKRTSW